MNSFEDGRDRTPVRAVGKIISFAARRGLRALPLRFYFAFNSKIVMEYGGNTRVKSVPKPVTFSVTGAT